MVDVREALDGIQGELALNREQHELNRELAQRQEERHAREMARIDEEIRNSRAVTRDQIAEMRQLREESRRHFEASHGALVDLAAEIRGWGGGAAPAA